MNTPVSSLDLPFAAAALRYGRRHDGLTSPNPCVAALVVANIGGSPRIVGRGVTAIGGRPHAEAQALQQAASMARGATLYVTLEPCNHQGLTPPCTEAILNSGITRVVACISDPDPRVSGTGFERLRSHGVEVVTPVLELQARHIHAGHISAKTTKRPHVLLKMAVSANGLIGVHGGGQVAISGPEAWTYVHGLRAVSEAILVGVGTVNCDDPSLTCRLPGLEWRSPKRVVLDAGNRIRPDAKVLSDERGTETRIYDNRSCEHVLKALGDFGIRSVMIEGGARVASRFLKAGLVDACHLIRSGQDVGTQDGVRAPLDLMTDTTIFEKIEGRRLGADELSIYWRKG